MLTIYGSDLSVFSNKVRFVANAIDLEYEYRIIKLRDGEHRSPKYIKMHPASKIPAMDDDGFVLFESDAIIRYLADKHNSDLYPRDVRMRARIDQWMCFVNNHIGLGVNKVAFNRIFAPRSNRPVDERSIKDGQMFLNRFLPIIDTQIAQEGYLAGSRMTLADLSLLSALDPAELAGIALDMYRSITPWRAQLKQRDFYTRCYTEYGEALRAS
jgi:glutathione S-transferase